MSTLFVMFDLKTNRFVGSSCAGKLLDGIAEVHLANGRVAVLDAEGRDLLAGPAGAAQGPVVERAVSDIAQAFGYVEPAVPDEDDRGGRG
jgi:hypothetical protein